MMADKGRKTNILFVSALDFKEKSIQVIRKTPEAFRDSGWEVTFIVARDESKSGDYFYERVFNPTGIRVVRINWPLSRLQDRTRGSVKGTIVSKLRSYLAIIGLAAKAAGMLSIERFDVVYGYEVHGYLAVCLMRLLGMVRGARVVARFQGFKQKQGLMALLNWEMFLALLVPAHVCIMTDDGTQGDRVLRYLRSANAAGLRFWTNGVDPVPPLSESENICIRQKMGCPSKCFLLVSISRLVPWKRVDRGIRIVERLVKEYGRKNIFYCIVGGGIESGRLQNLIAELDLTSHVKLAGPLEHSKALDLLRAADAFISTYDLSNVGNPLLEAIRAHKMIFTLDNGDTGKWIKHDENGFLYLPNDESIPAIARDLDRLMGSPELAIAIKKGILKTEHRLWTWEQRMKAEVDEIAGLVQACR